MSVQPMNCPKCGSLATECDKNKWRCLNPKCLTYFLYEPPKNIEQHAHQVVIGVPEDNEANKLLLFFTCAQCKGEFNKATNPEYKCPLCDVSLCQSCYESGGVRLGHKECRKSLYNECVAIIYGIILLICLFCFIASRLYRWLFK